ncbi:C6 transcription factor [Phlyctema vagabunda]|uniref:C6 transcription factor n=1 Tax=Phlyctema vagabunda TaxID=108571 RepID=A0ABR4P191_9HELO
MEAANANLNKTTKQGKPPRKGHRKSRQGCYECKRRRVKCPENRPSCDNCSRLSLRCRYIPIPDVTGSSPAPQQISSLVIEPSFSLTDLRLHHHFLVAAYPHFPVRSDNIWLSYILPIGHQCGYLMHAMLALAASHLEKLTHCGLTSIAQSHRLAAIKGLNAALGKPMDHKEEADAAIGACYALLMQSWYMEDGLQASLILTRSCEFTTRKVQAQNLGSILAEEGPDSRISNMRARMKDTPDFDDKFIDAAVKSTSDLLPLCEDKYQRTLFDGLIQAFTSLSKSPLEAYRHYVDIDKIIIAMDNTEILKLLDTQRTTCQLLLAHMIALHLIMRPISCRERRQYTVTMYGIRMSTWIPKIYENMAAEYQKFLAWPMTVSSQHNVGKLEQFTLSRQGSKKLRTINS